MSQTAIIIGAGPAGLTAAYELLTRTGIVPVILEQSSDVGGISKTVNYKGNRIDIGGHRFFSKSDRVMNWWLNMMPVDETGSITINYQHQAKTFTAGEQQTASAGNTEKIMLVRNRQSRIYYLKKFFAYPVTLSADTLKKLGFVKIIRIGCSYMRARLFPIKNEKSLEDFFINRFGRELYRTFFKDYTEKVWGASCKDISAQWGAQRIKELSVSKALWHAIKKVLGRKDASIGQKDTSTSLIERFLYPKYGPGQMWETVAEKIYAKGGTIHHGLTVTRLELDHNRVVAVYAVNEQGEEKRFAGDYVFSTMALKDLVAGICEPLPPEVKEVAAGLQYRDFAIVGLLLKKMTVKDVAYTNEKTRLIRDNWIYIQEKEVKLGRLQVFNNWSPFMVKDSETVWLGLEYFCNKGDELWNRNDAAFIRFAAEELEKIGLASAADVLDGTVLRMEKTYPAYFGTFARFDVLKDYLNTLENLYCVGRNGMHRYNNSDHSMLTALTAVDNIVAGIVSKENIWAINTEQEYHEEK